MIVDAYGLYSRRTDSPWNAGSLTAYREAVGCEWVLIGSLDAAPSSAGGSSQDEFEANLAALNFCRTQPGFRPFYVACPGRPDAHAPAAAGALALEPFQGCLFAPGKMGGGLEPTAYDPYFHFLTRNDLPAAFVLDRLVATPERVLGLIKRNRELRAVLCPGPTLRWTDVLEQVHHATAGSPEGRISLCTTTGRASEIALAVKQLGAAHVMLGTDAPVLGTEHATRVTTLLRELEASLSPGDFERVSHANADALFSLRSDASRSESVAEVG